MFFSFFDPSHKSYARSSMVMASVSTFQDHNATPAARVAARRCFSSHTCMETSSEDIQLQSFVATSSRIVILTPSATRAVGHTANGSWRQSRRLIERRLPADPLFAYPLPLRRLQT